jgi:predicted outer membrane repeat protein
VEALEERALLSANTYLVNLPGDAGTGSGLFGDLRYCVNQADQAANAGSTITFDTKAIGSSTITLSHGELAISDNMTIQGPGASNLTISGGKISRVFDITATTAVVTISNLTISGGSASETGETGGGINNAGSLTVSDCALAGNSAYEGGGIFSGTSLAISDCTLSGNSANFGGGGIANVGSGTVRGCNLSGNSADGNPSGGGGIDNVGSLTVSDSTLSGNSATGIGGGIENFDTLTLSDCTLSGNSATNGGGIFSSGAGRSFLTVIDCTLSGNSASDAGGGIDNTGGIWPGSLATLTVIDSTLSGNSANFGGGIVNGVPSSMTVSDCTLSGNTANGPSAAGGGIYNGGILTVSDSTLSGNSANGPGVIGLPGGGGIESGPFLTISDSTLSGNSTSGSGGGIAILPEQGPVTLINVTIADNRSIHSGGGLYTGGTLTLHNTLIAGNLNDGAPSDVSGSLDPASDYNLLGVDTGMTGISNGSNGNQVGAASNLLNPLLAPLGNNGGPTQTMALLPGSPAIDHGSNAYVTPGETDQRGLPRISGARVDIGAFEPQTTSPPAPPPAPPALPLAPSAPVLVGLSSAFDSQGLMATIAVYSNGDLYLLLPGYVGRIDTGILSANLYTNAQGQIGLVLVLQKNGAAFAIDPTGVYFLGQGLFNVSPAFDAAGRVTLVDTDANQETLANSPGGYMVFNYGRVINVFQDGSGNIGADYVLTPGGKLIQVSSAGMGVIDAGVVNAANAFASSNASVFDLVMSSGQGLMMTLLGSLDVNALVAAFGNDSRFAAVDQLFSEGLGLIAEVASALDPPAAQLFALADRLLGVW